MKFGKPKTERFSSITTWKAKKKGYKVEVVYNRRYDSYYFFINKEDIDFRFNSVWKQLEYKDFDECCRMAEKYLDTQILNK